MRVMRYHVVFLLLVLLLPWPAGAEVQDLSDEELDQVTARGVSLNLKLLPDGALEGIGFTFDLGGTSGNGSIEIPSPPVTVQPINLFANGVDLSHSLLRVENLILNLNICFQCQATTINQIGQGVPITIRP